MLTGKQTFCIVLISIRGDLHMPEAFQNWAHNFHDFCPIGVAIAIVWLIGDVGYRSYVSNKSFPSTDAVARARRWPS